MWVIVDRHRVRDMSFVRRWACMNFVFAFNVMLKWANDHPDHRIWLERDEHCTCDTIYGPE